MSRSLFHVVASQKLKGKRDVLIEARKKKRIIEYRLKINGLVWRDWFPRLDPFGDKHLQAFIRENMKPGVA